MGTDHSIDEVLARLGFADPEARAVARQALVEAGLVNPRKARVSAAKLERIGQALDERLARACSDPACQAALARDKPQAARVAVPARDCEHCGGSDNRKAMRVLAEACARAGVTRVVVVGGSPSVHAELTALKPRQWELRLVEGTERRTLDRARSDLEWAHLVFIWGSSELDHRVSRLYTEAPVPHRRKLVMVARRGIAALLRAGTEHLRKRSP